MNSPIEETPVDVPVDAPVDVSEPISTEEVVPVAPVKPKRVMSDKQKLALAEGRRLKLEKSKISKLKTTDPVAYPSYKQEMEDYITEYLETKKADTLKHASRKRLPELSEPSSDESDETSLKYSSTEEDLSATDSEPYVPVVAKNPSKTGRNRHVYPHPYTPAYTPTLQFL
jgi:hypothetical protein